MIFQNKRHAVIYIMLALSVPIGATQASFEILTQIQRQIIEHIINNTKNIATNDIKVTITNSKQIEKMPKKFTSYKLGIEKKAKLIGETTLPLKFFNEQEEICEIPMHSKVQVWGKVVRATQLLPKGITLTTQNIDTSYQIINTEPPEHITDQDQVIGKETAYTIAPGTTLTARMVRKPSLIKSGDIVYIINNKNGIQIQIKAKALSDGARGSQIRAKTLMAEPKIIQGEVLDEQHIKMASDD